MKKIILIAGLILIVGCGKSGPSDPAVADCVRYNSERIVDREQRQLIDVMNATWELESTTRARGHARAKRLQDSFIRGCREDINYIY